MNIQAFLGTLPIMGKGMLGIFVVMAVIFILIAALGAFSKGDDGKDEN